MLLGVRYENIQFSNLAHLTYLFTGLAIKTGRVTEKGPFILYLSISFVVSFQHKTTSDTLHFWNKVEKIQGKNDHMIIA